MSRCYCNCCPEYIKSTQYNLRGWSGVKAWESTAGAVRIQVPARRRWRRWQRTRQTEQQQQQAESDSGEGDWTGPWPDQNLQHWGCLLVARNGKIISVGRCGHHSSEFLKFMIDHLRILISQHEMNTRRRRRKRISPQDRETLRGHLAASSVWNNSYAGVDLKLIFEISIPSTINEVATRWEGNEWNRKLARDLIGLWRKTETERSDESQSGLDAIQWSRITAKYVPRMDVIRVIGQPEEISPRGTRWGKDEFQKNREETLHLLLINCNCTRDLSVQSN